MGVGGGGRAGVGGGFSAGDISSRGLAGPSAVVVGHARATAPGVWLGLGSRGGSLFFFAFVAHLYSGAAGQLHRMAGTERVLCALPRAMGGFLLEVVSRRS